MSASRSFLVGLLVVFLLCFSRFAAADVVTDWNVATYQVLRRGSYRRRARRARARHGPRRDGRRDQYGAEPPYALCLQGPAAACASAEAAAASAARAVLSALLPAQKARIDEAYAVTTREIQDGPAKAAGEALGKEAAEAVIADRANDNTSCRTLIARSPRRASGAPTTPPLTAQYARAKPWGFERPDQFRPGPPPALASAQYARDYNETKTLGGVRSSGRTQEQSEAVKFWSQPNIMEAWHQVSRQLPTIGSWGSRNARASSRS